VRVIRLLLLFDTLVVEETLASEDAADPLSFAFALAGQLRLVESSIQQQNTLVPVNLFGLDAEFDAA
jgi:hypothetical protein